MAFFFLRTETHFKEDAIIFQILIMEIVTKLLRG